MNAECTLKDCLFGNAKITKNADPDKYSYSGYGLDLIKNAIMFGVDMSSSEHIDNKNEDILILGKGPHKD